MPAAVVIIAVGTRIAEVGGHGCGAAGATLLAHRECRNQNLKPSKKQNKNLLREEGRESSEGYVLLMYREPESQDVLLALPVQEAIYFFKQQTNKQKTDVSFLLIVIKIILNDLSTKPCSHQMSCSLTPREFD